MTDITKCNGAGCSLKNDCYRFTAPSHEYRQSIFVVAPVVTDELTGEQSCEEYWKRNE